MNLSCPNCGTAAVVVREVRVRRTIPAELTHCPHCDFLFLRDPHWLPQAYEVEFYGDTGYVQRNLEQARFVGSLLSAYRFRYPGRPLPRGCDLGTGLGLFPRLMRDRGYLFEGQDRYASMALIRPFVTTRFDAALYTAFEVVEHAVSLTDLLAPCLAAAELIIFSTLLRPEGVIPDDDWWYYAFPLGQHVSFHSVRSIREALTQLGVPAERFRSVDPSLHAVIQDRRWRGPMAVASALHRRWYLHPVASGLARIGRRPSRHWSDHLEVMRTLSGEEA